MNSPACRADLAHTTPSARKPSFQFTKTSSYDRVEEERLKVEQSATTDLPMHALTVEMREGILAAASATIKTESGETPAVHLKRTAHALATLEPQSKTEQAATMVCLPAFASKISLACKTAVSTHSAPSLASTAPRRILLPPPKTVFLPAEDPVELRLLVQEMQQKRCQTIENARITSRLQTLSAIQLPARNVSPSLPLGKLRAFAAAKLRAPLKRLSGLLGDLIDKLAVA